MSDIQDIFDDILTTKQDPVKQSALLDMADSFGWERTNFNDIREENIATKGNARRGLSSGIDSTQAMLGGAVGLAGDAVGIEAVRDWGFNTYIDNTREASLNPLDVQNFTDINTDNGIGTAISDTGKWFAGTIGQLAPSVAQGVISTLIGGAVGTASAGPVGTAGGAMAGMFGRKMAVEAIDKAVSSYIKKGVSKEIAEATVKKQLIKKAAAYKVGANVGLVQGTAAMEGGGMWGEDAGIHGVENANAGSAFALGQVSGLSEKFSPGGMLIKRIAGVKGISPVADKVADTLLKRLGTEVPKAMGGEAAQEIFQSFLGILNKKINDPTVSLTDREAISEYINSGAAGAAGGMLFGGASAAFPERPAASTPPPTPPVEELPAAHTVDDVLDNHQAKAAVETAVAREGIQNAGQMDMTANTVGEVLGQQDHGLDSSFSSDLVRLHQPIQEMALSLYPKPDEDGKTELPVWVKLKALKDWEKETGEPVKSFVSSKSSRETLQAVLAGEPLSPKQVKVWGYLKSVAENKAMAKEQESLPVPEPSTVVDNVEPEIALATNVENPSGLGSESPYAPGNQGETGPLSEEPPANHDQEPGETKKNDGIRNHAEIVEEGDSYPLPAGTTIEGNDNQPGGYVEGPVSNMEAEPSAEVEAEPLPTPSTEKHEVIDNPDSVAHGQEMNTNPSDAQKEAENYRMAHVKVDGFDISIENPAGSTRKGKSPDGKEWESKMFNDYGRIKATVGNDQDHVDVFFKAGYQGGADTVHIVNQANKDGSFDEHKVIMGAATPEAAMGLYNVNYEKGWTGGKSVVSMPVAEFKEWVKGEGPSKGELAGGESFKNTHQEHTEAGELVANESTANTVVERKTENINAKAPDITQPGFSNVPDIIEHTTKKGKIIKGIVRTDITLAEAKEIDKYTFRKDGGFFIREKHLKAEEKALDPTSDKSDGKTPGNAKSGEAKETEQSGSPEKSSSPVENIQEQTPSEKKLAPSQEDGVPESLGGSESTNTKTEKPSEPKKPQDKEYGADNKLFTQEAADDALAILKAELANLNTGLNPKLMQAGITRAGFHVEAGIRSFAKYSKKMVSELGDVAKPFLKTWYNSVHDYPGFDNSGMDNYQAVADADIDNILNDKTEPKKKKSDLDVAKAELKVLDAEIEQLYKLRECLSA